MDATITVGELLVVLMSILGVGVLVYLLILVIRLNDTLKNIQQVVNRNEKHIDESLALIPKVLDHVEGITKNVDQSMGHVQSTIEHVNQVSEYAQDMVEGINEEVVEPLKEAFQTLLMIKSFFRGSRKKKWF